MLLHENKYLCVLSRITTPFVFSDAKLTFLNQLAAKGEESVCKLDCARPKDLRHDNCPYYKCYGEPDGRRLRARRATNPRIDQQSVGGVKSVSVLISSFVNTSQEGKIFLNRCSAGEHSPAQCINDCSCKNKLFFFYLSFIPFNVCFIVFYYSSCLPNSRSH